MMGPGAAALRFSGGGPGLSTGRIQGSPAAGLSYPNPFFDIAHTYLPTSVRGLFRWCRYYFLTNPLINAAIFKMSEYPITDYVMEGGAQDSRERWSKYLEGTLKLRSFQIELGLNYHTYGNAFVSISYPFIKHLYCTASGCGYTSPAHKIREYWKMSNCKFRLTCPRCQRTTDASARDEYIRNASAIKLLTWSRGRRHGLQRRHGNPNLLLHGARAHP